MLTFQQFAEAHGVLIRKLVSSDRIQRCPTTTHPKSTNGAYLWDGQRGGVMAWDGEGAWHWWRDDNAKPWTDAEKRAWAMKQREAERAREDGQKRAALAAAIQLRACTYQPHGYLELKGFPTASGLVDADGTLHIPMRDYKTNELLGSQRIYRDGDKWVKKMTPGMRAKGAVLRIGQAKARETWLVEGYATGLSTQAALKAAHADAAVLVCFSTSTMKHMAAEVRGEVYVFADHDAPNLEFPERGEAGQKAARATGLPYCMAPTVGHDANDWHQASGINPLVRAIMELRRTRAAA